MTTHRDDAGTWFHPLITPYTPRCVGRRRFLMIGGGGLAVAAGVAPRLRLVTAQDATPATVPGLGVTGDDDAVALLEQAAQVMALLETFSFEVATVAGETAIFDVLTLESIEGSVRRPMDFTATVSVSTPIGSMTVTAVAVDGSAWIQNPLGDGEWTSLDDIGDLSAIINPDALILSSINVIQDATIDGSDRIDGVDAVRVAGTVSIAEAADRMTQGTFEVPSELSTEPLDVLIWIDDQKHVLEIELAGPILAAEDDNVIRSFRFFEFDEPVQIEAPQI